MSPKTSDEEITGGSVLCKPLHTPTLRCLVVAVGSLVRLVMKEDVGWEARRAARCCLESRGGEKKVLPGGRCGKR